MGRWSRMVAVEYLAWLAPLPNARWLEIGCGSGALTAAIAEKASPSSLDAIEPSPNFAVTAQDRVGNRARIAVGNANALPFAQNSFDVVVSGLVLNFVTPLDTAMAEMRRVARPGGVVSAYVWDYAEGMEMLRLFWDVARAIDSAAAALDEAVRFPLCRPDPLRRVFGRAGFEAITVCPIEIVQRFEDFDDYWIPFSRGQGPAPSFVTSLGSAKRAELRNGLHAVLQPQQGPLELTSRAWAVSGRVPRRDGT